MANDIIRAEKKHSINGVSGRFNILRRPPAPWVSGVFANQTWVSESRSVSGYGKNGSMIVQIRFDDNCKNKRMSFAVTASIYTDESRRRHDVAACGCLHDEIEKVFPELAHLIKWHLCYTDGPMHYVENTCYHALAHGFTHAWVYFTGSFDPLNIGETKERLLGYVKSDVAKQAEGGEGYRVKWDENTIKTANLAHARSSAVWPEATDEQLQLPKPQLSALLESRLPALLAAMRADIEAAGFLWECPATD